MTQALHNLARAYFAAVTAGDLPDDLCCDDMTAWITTGGTMSKSAYQHVIRLLARMCAEPTKTARELASTSLPHASSSGRPCRRPARGRGRSRG